MVQIEISINGVAYPCRPDLCGAMLRFKELTGKEATEMDMKSLTEFITWLYCGVLAACGKDRREFAMTLMEFADSIAADDIQAISEAIAKSTASAPAPTPSAKKKTKSR